MGDSWVPETSVPFVELHAFPVGDTDDVHKAKVASSLVKILFNDNRAQTWNELQFQIDNSGTLGGYQGIADPALVPGFELDKFRRHLRAFLPITPGRADWLNLETIPEVIEDQHVVAVNRELFLYWTRKILGYLREPPNGGFERHIEINSADNTFVIRRHVPESPPGSPLRSPPRSPEDPRSLPRSSAAPSAVGSPGDPIPAGGRRRTRRRGRKTRRRGHKSRRS